MKMNSLGTINEKTLVAIPLQVFGTLDVNLTNMLASDLILYGLANLWNNGQEGSYIVRHETHLVRDFGKS